MHIIIQQTITIIWNTTLQFTVCVSTLLDAGLIFLHRHHIIHRDLKPENILLKKGPTGEVVIKICLYCRNIEIYMYVHVYASFIWCCCWKGGKGFLGFFLYFVCFNYKYWWYVLAKTLCCEILASSMYGVKSWVMLTLFTCCTTVCLSFFNRQSTN